jgi:hypothetical protein
MTRKTRSHGLSGSSEYRAWQTMRLRCTNPNNAAWPSYGGRGITVCDRWLDDPAAFVEDMGTKPSPLHELDRIDNDSGYAPENCRWVLRKINDRNRRSNRRVAHAGETLTVAEWAERTGIESTTITYRIKAGWTNERILTTPARAKAAKGLGKGTLRRPCQDCGQPVAMRSIRCKPCANREKLRAMRDGSISQAVAMVGNSVSPPPMRAIAAANLDSIPVAVAV